MATIQWDESRKDDKQFLMEYYQQVADKWKPIEKAKKTYQHFQKAADDLRKELEIQRNDTIFDTEYEYLNREPDGI